MENWSSADTIFLVLLCAFGIRGVVKGFMRSLFGVLAVIGGFLLATFLFRESAIQADMIPLSYLSRCSLMFIALFLIGYVIVKIIGAMIHKGAEITMLGGMDRVFGFFFGVVQGIVLLILLVMIGLLSPSSERFKIWANEGTYAPMITSGSELLANRARTFTDEITRQLSSMLLKWGVSHSAIDKLFGNPELMQELIKQGETRPTPGVAIPVDNSLYDQIKVVVATDSLSNEKKSQKIWQLIVSKQEYQRAVTPEVRPDPRFK